MKRMSKIIALLLVLAFVFVGVVACKDNTPDENPSENPSTNKPDGNKPVVNPLAGTYDITMWVSEKEGVADQFKQQIAEFMAANPGIIINASIEGVTEADAGSKVVADVASAPDMYCFAQDQLARLVQAAALAGPGGDIAKLIKESNDAGSVAAASVAGTIYAYPMTSDNGYYMYYDTSIISEEDAESLEAIIAACEDSGKLFRFALENAWYTASFFFATGCNSNWSMNEDGDFIAVDDDFNSTKGLIAMKGMQKLAQSSIYDSNADIFTDAGVVVTGIWNAEAAEAHFGENFGVTDLPSFTVDGESYHLGSYTGNKLLGVKPQQDKNRAAVLSLLAQYLTNEACQTQRYESFQWGPSNLAAQQSEAVQANPSLAALAKQNAYGQPQGQIHGSWWDIAKVLGAEAKAATSEQDLKDALTDYQAAIDGLFQMTEEQKMAWSVIGSVNGASWDTDFAMTKVNDTTWESVVLNLEAGQEFKLRRGAAWVPQIGVTNDNTGETDGGYYVRLADSNPEPGNIVVEVTGSYKVQLVWDGTSTSAVVNLIPA